MPASQPSQQQQEPTAAYVYRRDLAYTPPEAGEGADEAQLRRIVRELVPAATDAPEASVVVKAVGGGITNALFRVSFGDGDRTDAVRVRVFGGEGMIDRDVETATYCALADAGFAPPCYGRFANGRVEGWIGDAVPLTLDQMADPTVSPRVARELARLHSYTLPEHLQVHHAEPGMWAQLWAWHDQARRGVPTLEVKRGADVAAAFEAAVADKLGPSFERSTRELKELEAAIPKDAKTVFCHNDALAGNILYNPETGAVHLIDFEYGGCNYRGFDIANHWNEWAGGTQLEMNGRAEYGRFPSAEQRAAFCREYLGECARIKGRGGAADDDAVDALVDEAQRFVLTNHWYWGLWAVNQAVLEGTDEFDFVTYASARLTQYYAVKAEYLG